MLRWNSLAALGAVLLIAQGCAKPAAQDAGDAAHALLAAAQAGDTHTFETFLDRPAVRAGLRAQMIEIARNNGLDVGGPSDVALDRMIAPEALKLVQAGIGAPLASTPSVTQVTAIMKTLDHGRACLHDLTPQQSCLLTFAREKPGWRLVSMRAGDLNIALPAEPAKAS